MFAAPHCGLALAMAKSPAMWPFAKSVLYGALAASAPVLVLVFLMIVASLTVNPFDVRDVFAALLLLLLPLGIAIPVVLAGMVAIGLPLTLLLRRRGWESAAAYIGVGLVAGWSLPMAYSAWFAPGPSDPWMALLGAGGGAMAARTWWINARKPKRAGDALPASNP